MKKTFLPLLCAVIFICGCAGNRDFIKHPDDGFIAQNQDTAYLPLSRVTEYVNLHKEVIRSESREDAALPGFDGAIADLIMATKLPPVDFSSCNNSSPAEILDFIAAIPDFTRLLMLNYKAGIESGRPEMVYASLLSALRLDTAVAGYPYVIGVFMNAARMEIIFEEIKDSASGAPLNTLSVAELETLLAEVRKLQTDLNQRWRNAYLFDASLNDAVYMEFFESQLKPQLSVAEQQQAMALWRDLNCSFAQYLADDNDALYQEMLKKEKAFNRYLKSKYVIPITEGWVKCYKSTANKLNMLEALLLAVKYKVQNGIYPESLAVDMVEYSVVEDGFTLSCELFEQRFTPIFYGGSSEKYNTTETEADLLQLF